MFLNAVETIKLSMQYGSRKILHEVDLIVPEDCILGIVGLNGAGKSTIIRLLLGLIQPTSGHVEVLGVNPTCDFAELRSSVGYVPEIPRFYPWMTVAETVAFVSAFFHDWDVHLCERLLRRFELDPAKRTSQLSKGMRAKLAIVGALSHHAKLLLLDEATDGLDPLARKELLEAVAEAAVQDGAAVVCASHILEDIEKVAQRIAIIHDGKLVSCMKMDEIRSNYKHVEIVLAAPASDFIPPPGTMHHIRDGAKVTLLVNGLSSQGISMVNTGQVVDVIIRAPSLAEFFEGSVCKTKALQ